MARTKSGKIIPLNVSKIRSINPKKERLTVEILRQFPSMKNLSEEDATVLVVSINTFSSILYELCKNISKNGTILVDNQEVKENKINKAA